ncbi:MAG: ABC transporter permease [Actinomycetota bacterium]
MSTAALALRQVKFENRSFWRNPAAAFFTFIFPLIFLFVFNTVFGEEQEIMFGVEVNASQFYVPAIAAFSVISACFTNIAISLTFARELGILKRLRGTPLPPWVYFFGRLAHSIIVAILLVIIVTAVGALVYDVDVPTETLAEFTLALAVGAAAFSSLALAVTAIIPNENAAPPIVNATILPLLFISDVFFGPDASPEWLQKVADVFPVRPFNQALVAAFNPTDGASNFEIGDVMVVAAWGVVGVVLAIRFFSWEPRR